MVLIGDARAGLCQQPPGNSPDRLEWFRDQGFGLFIHWSVDSQLGTVISHSLVGASDDYASRFFDDLPKTFNPLEISPRGLGGAREAGRRDDTLFSLPSTTPASACSTTATTDFSILHTPFKRDI